MGKDILLPVLFRAPKVLVLGERYPADAERGIDYLKITLYLGPFRLSGQKPARRVAIAIEFRHIVRIGIYFQHRTDLKVLHIVQMSGIKAQQQMRDKTALVIVVKIPVPRISIVISISVILCILAESQHTTQLGLIDAVFRIRGNGSIFTLVLPFDRGGRLGLPDHQTMFGRNSLQIIFGKVPVLIQIPFTILILTIFQNITTQFRRLRRSNYTDIIRAPRRLNPFRDSGSTTVVVHINGCRPVGIPQTAIRSSK